MYTVCLDPPEITKPPVSHSVKSGGIAVFFCQATGEPTPAFSWKKNGKKLKNTDSRYVVEKKKKNIATVLDPLPAAPPEKKSKFFFSGLASPLSRSEGLKHL